MPRNQTYRCSVCGITRILTAEPYESTREFEEDLPDDLDCYTKGCKGLLTKI